MYCNTIINHREMSKYATSSFHKLEKRNGTEKKNPLLLSIFLHLDPTD